VIVAARIGAVAEKIEAIFKFNLGHRVECSKSARSKIGTIFAKLDKTSSSQFLEYLENIVPI
jgi:hypothetical protein